MCLALLALDMHPRFVVVVAANRDEYHARPTAPAAWWPEGWLAGRDLAGGGTWLGVTRQGRFALLTNYRDPPRHDPAAPSRGALVPSLLAGDEDVASAAARVRAEGGRYNGFSVVAGTPTTAVWTSNRAPDVRRLRRGVYGLSNALLDEPWPKLARTKAALQAWTARGADDIEALFALLSNRGVASDGELPSTGVTLEWERRLSAPFIVSAAYGTRCSTVLAIDRDGVAMFVERSFDADGERSGEVAERFTVASATLS